SQAFTPPGGQLSFSANGGIGPPYTWSLRVNASGGSVDPTTGAYVAGRTGRVTDIVWVTDTLGNVAGIDVGVGPTVRIDLSYVPPSAPPHGQLTFTAIDGSGGYVWSVASTTGGTINASTGVYTAG